MLYHLGERIFLPESEAYLRKRRLDKDTITSPVCIVASGSGGLERQDYHQWHELLKDVFRNYAVSIISGGTTTGIPGLLGVITEDLAQKKSANGILS